MTIDEAFKAGKLRLRLPNWAQCEWLELIPVQDGAYYGPFGKLHSVLNGDDVPDGIRIAPQDMPLWMVPQDGWEAHDA